MKYKLARNIIGVGKAGEVIELDTLNGVTFAAQYQLITEEKKEIIEDEESTSKVPKKQKNKTEVKNNGESMASSRNKR